MRHAILKKIPFAGLSVGALGGIGDTYNLKKFVIGGIEGGFINKNLGAKISMLYYTKEYAHPKLSDKDFSMIPVMMNAFLRLPLDSIA